MRPLDWLAKRAPRSRRRQTLVRSPAELRQPSRCDVFRYRRGRDGPGQGNVPDLWRARIRRSTIRNGQTTLPASFFDDLEGQPPGQSAITSACATCTTGRIPMDRRDMWHNHVKIHHLQPPARRRPAHRSGAGCSGSERPGRQHDCHLHLGSRRARRCPSPAPEGQRRSRRPSRRAASKYPIRATPAEPDGCGGIASRPDPRILSVPACRRKSGGRPSRS